MAFDDELKKRRAQREAMRQKRLAEHRQLVTKLIIAGVVLVLCAVLIFTVAARSGPDTPTEPQGTTTVPEATGGSTGEPSPGTTESTADPTDDSTASTDGPTASTDDPTGGTEAALSTGASTQPTGAEPTGETQMADTTVIHLTAAGDVNINDTTAALDFQAAFQDILPLLSAGDLTTVNFEGNLVGEPYGEADRSAPQTLMIALRNAGVDLIQMANSRSIHNGLDGLGTTLSAIRSAGLEPVGAWATAEEAQRSGGYTIREVNGVRLAIVAFTKGMDSMALPAGSEDCVNVLYTDYATTYQEVDSEGITAVLEAVAEEEPDLTIALVHWGSEFRDQRSDTQTEIRNLMLQNGVDAIIGTHPHYVQAMEYDEDNGTFVAYSLGDLLSDGETAGTEYSVILDLEITKDHISGETKITGYSYTPIFNVRREGQGIRIMRLEEAIAAYESGHMLRVSQEMYEDMLYARTRIEARVAGE